MLEKEPHGGLRRKYNFFCHILLQLSNKRATLLLVEFRRGFCLQNSCELSFDRIQPGDGGMSGKGSLGRDVWQHS